MNDLLHLFDCAGITRDSFILMIRVVVDVKLSNCFYFLNQGVYEMRLHTVLPGKLEQFSHRFQQGVEDRNKYSQMVGIWYCDFGELNQGL